MPDYSAYTPRIQAILRPLSRELAALIDSVATGSLDVLSWQREVERVLARYITASFMAGRGRFTLDESELAAVRKWVAAQTGYIDRFAMDMLNDPIDEGEDFPKKWRNRAVMYATSIVQSFYGGETWGIPLPAMPGDGTSQCGQNDKCTWRIVKLSGKGNWDAYWELHPAEHCFPGDTMIMTPGGEREIRELSSGDYVTTMNGKRKITKVFKNKLESDLVSFYCNDRKITCTKNHPILTKHGWVIAGNIGASDYVVFSQDGKDFFFGNVSFPDANNRKPNRSKINILGCISSFLGNLLFCEWLKSFVSVPVLPVCLNNEVPDFNVNNKVGLDEKRRNVVNSEFIKYASQFEFEFTWFIFLGFLFSGKKGFVSFGELFGIIFPSLKHFILRIFVEHWVVIRHSFARNRINDFVSSIFRKNKMNPIRFISNPDRINIESDTNRLASIVRIMLDKIRYLFLSPEESIAGFAEFSDDVSSVLPALLANATEGTISLSGFGYSSVSANNAAKSWQRLPAPLIDKIFTAFLTSELLLGSVHKDIIPDDIYVYNLEVEQDHHYIANGVVVHNCQTCIERARLWNPLQIRDYQLLIPSDMMVKEFTRITREALTER